MALGMREAKQLFFRYDGSHFFMSRDGVEAEYQSAGVPPEVEAAWLEELTCDKLRLLSQDGNWTVLHFLNHHTDTDHLAEVMQAVPRGVLWQRCAYLEQFLTYASNAGQAGVDPSRVSRAAIKA